MTVLEQSGVLKTGIDAQSISSFREHSGAVAGGIRRRVFTDDERDYCKNTEFPAQHYAARWAAKEAFIKLLLAKHSTHFHDVAVDKDGPIPVYSLGDRAIGHLCQSCDVIGHSSISLDLSLSHDRDADIAVAQAVVSSHGESGDR